MNKMEESKSGPYDLQQAVSLFMARKVGLRTVSMALQRCPESVEGLSYTVGRSRGDWSRLKRLHDSTVGTVLFSSMTVLGKVVWDASVDWKLRNPFCVRPAVSGDAFKKMAPRFHKMKRLALQRKCSLCYAAGPTL